MDVGQCTLRRCQGKRGCLCPKGKIPVGCYGNPKLVEAKEVVLFSSPSSKNPIRATTSPARIKPKTESPSKQRDGTNETRESHRDKLAMRSLSDDTESPKSPGSSVNQMVATEKAASLSSANENNSGLVVIRYSHYKTQFEVHRGSLKAEDIDKEYALLFAYPDAKIRLSLFSPSDFSYEEKGFSSPPLVQEDPEGTFQGIDVTKEYWVHMEESASQRKEYEERAAVRASENAAKRAAQEEAEKLGLSVPTVGKQESCSCLEGNPCVDAYCCKDWNNRYEVAKRNGWKGFQ